MRLYVPGVLIAMMLPAAAFAAPTNSATGTWKINGDVQGTPVAMTCVLVEAEHKLTGSCTAAAGPAKPRMVVGATTEKSLEWHFDTEYEGNPITVSMAASLAEDGTKMSGTMSVDPMAVDGTFTAVRVADTPASPAETPAPATDGSAAAPPAN